MSTEQEAPQIEEYLPGRPFIFKDAKELAIKIQAYFDKCDPHVITRMQESGYNNEGKTIFLEREAMTEQRSYTVTGLARYLKVSRRTLLNYTKTEHYSDDIDPQVRQDLILTIEDAFQRVEEFNEGQLHKSGIANGVKFNLTNNFGWIDKQVVDTTIPPVGDVLDELDAKTIAAAELARQAQKALDDEDAEGPNETPGSETTE